jgi:hypothetical protein
MIPKDIMPNHVAVPKYSVVVKMSFLTKIYPKRKVP